MTMYLLNGSFQEKIRWAAGGFSLIEVTLAIGIVSFALLAIIGVLPIGLVNAQQSIRQTTYSHMISRISSDLSLVPFSELSEGRDIYFDSDGLQMASAENATFCADIRPGQQGAAYPGSERLDDLQAHLKNVTVSIKRLVASDTDGYKTVIFVANSGR